MLWYQELLAHVLLGLEAYLIPKKVEKHQKFKVRLSTASAASLVASLNDG